MAEISPLRRRMILNAVSKFSRYFGRVGRHVEMKFLSANSISEFSHGLGHSRPMRSAPVPLQVRIGLKADVAG